MECHRINQKVAGSIPSQGTYLGCSSVPGRGVYGRQPINVSLSHWCFSSSPHFSLSKKQWKKCPWVRIKNMREKSGFFPPEVGSPDWNEWIPGYFWEMPLLSSTHLPLVSVRYLMIIRWLIQYHICQRLISRVNLLFKELSWKPCPLIIPCLLLLRT